MIHCNEFICLNHKFDHRRVVAHGGRMAIKPFVLGSMEDRNRMSCFISSYI